LEQAAHDPVRRLQRHVLEAVGEWQEARVWQRLHETLLAELQAASLLDPMLVVSTHLRALRVETTPGRARSTDANQAPSTT
jgi:hypothetical protein